MLQNYKDDLADVISDTFQATDIYGLSVIDYSFKAKFHQVGDMLKSFKSDESFIKYSLLKPNVTATKLVTDSELATLQRDEPVVFSLSQVDTVKNKLDYKNLLLRFSEKAQHLSSNIDINFAKEFNIRFISDELELKNCLDEILESQIIGVDMEYTPASHSVEIFETFTLLQIATLHSIFVIDATKLFFEIKLLFKEVFENSYILKLTFGCAGDLKILFTYWGMKLKSFFDLAIGHSVWTKSNSSVGLATLARNV